MATVIRALLERAIGRFLDDLRRDPYLAPILLLAALLSGFWFWHRIPNFATRDEHQRLLDPLVAYARVLEDPSVESLRTGVSWGRVPYGATFYFFGLAVLPVVAAAMVTGRGEAIVVLGEPSGAFGYYPTWRAAPRWVWTWSLLLVRLFNAAIAVGCVYLTYRIGAAARDRATGRLAALLLTLTFGFLTLAHEGGEDVPALFFLLGAFYLALRYARTGDRMAFLAGSAAGGVAIAFKLTAAPIVLVIALAFLLRVRNAAPDWRDALFRPGLVVGGALLGLTAIVLGFPMLLVGSVDPVLERVFVGPTDRMASHTGPAAPSWWWFLRNYLNALGLPLLAAAPIGLLGGLATLGRRGRAFDATVLALAVVASYVVVLSGFHDFRAHHLLPTLPMLALLLAVALVRLRERRPAVGTPLVVVLLLGAGLYAGVGTAGYASMPRDDAEAWLAEHAGGNGTMEVYAGVMQDAAVPHGVAIDHEYQSRDRDETTCPEYVQLTYRDLLHLSDDPAVNRNPDHAAYVRSLLAGETGYEVVAEFGPRPPNYVPDRPRPGSLDGLLAIGLVPHSPEYADEQELTPDQYTLIFEHTGACERPVG